jgi:hypothetical protein
MKTSTSTARVLQKQLINLLKSEENNAEKWYHLFTLFSRPWFSRLWVVQEVALAKEVVVLCGSHSVPWGLFSVVIPNLIASREVLRVHFGPKIRPLIQKLWDSIDLVNIRQSYKTIPTMTLLHDAAGRKCVDSRDRIYGLMGITDPQLLAVIDPDYSKSIISVYRDLAIHFLMNNKSLEILSCCTYQDSSDSKPEWLSWVCDWSRKRIDPIFTFNRTFLASAGIIPRISLSKDQETLCIQGKVVDKLILVSSHLGATLSSCKTLSFHELEFIRYSWLLECLAISTGEPVDFVVEDVTKPFPKGYATAVLAGTSIHAWEELHLDEIAAFENALRRFLSQWTNISQSASNNHILSSTELAMIHASMAYAEDRRFCKTSQARLGLVPVLALPNDIVCVLYGANTPFILRQDDDSHYKIIGEAYIEETMDGRSLDKYGGTVNFKIR